MYQVPQISRFLDRSEYLKPPWLTRALVEFVERWMSIELDVGDEQAQEEHSPGALHLNIRIISEGMVREVLHSIQVLHQLSASLFNVVDLTIRGPMFSGPMVAGGLFFGGPLFGELPPIGLPSGGPLFSGEPLLPGPPGRQDSIDHIEWQALLRPFTAVNTLRLRGELSENVIYALEWVKGEMVAQVLPALHVLHLQNPSISLERFISVRQNAGHPVVVNVRLPDPDPDEDDSGQEEFSE